MKRYGVRVNKKCLNVCIEIVIFSCFATTNSLKKLRQIALAVTPSKNQHTDNKPTAIVHNLLIYIHTHLCVYISTSRPYIYCTYCICLSRLKLINARVRTQTSKQTTPNATSCKRSGHTQSKLFAYLFISLFL